MIIITIIMDIITIIMIIIDNHNNDINNHNNNNNNKNNLFPNCYHLMTGLKKIEIRIITCSLRKRTKFKLFKHLPDQLLLCIFGLV